MKKGKYIKTFKLLLPYLWPKKRKDLRIRVSFAVVSLVLAKIASVSTPLVLGSAVNSLTELSSGINLFMLVPIALVVGYGVTRVIAFTFVEIRDALFSKVSQHSIRQISLTMFKHLHNLSLQFHLNRQTGALAKYIDRGTKGIDFLLRYVLFNIAPTFFEVFLVSGILFYLYGPWYAVVTLVTIGLYSFLTFKITEWRNVFRKRMNQADNDVSTKMIDSLLNFETVKYFNNENFEANRLDQSLEEYELAANQSRHSLSLLNIAQTFIIMVGITIMLVMSVYGIKSGEIDIGGFVVINAYMLQLYQPLNWLGSVYREIRQALTDMENMFSLLEVAPTTNNDLNDIPQSNDAEIRFENISFDYDIRRTIIKNITFTVPNGKKVAIVGPTGAGKSTISRLLFKFYDPKEGNIFINNTNVNKISQNSLRKIIGVVPQDTVLFNDTIYYNIAYGNTGATKEEVISAAQNADIHDFITILPDGYETIVGERGLKLSGGEKQRVAIARTILKNPKIFFFDEATSALDTSTEKEIQKNLENISKGKTTLIIAHRLSTAANADNIIVLDQGAIIEQGTHESLLLEKGKYFEMWGKQKPS
ncbi:ABC transporter ATP-binding protein/permease [Candidatus Pelagibacter bacterium]|nr:ABC transporter ATP-binding protein/permease [Candidatus Pelagibacter sp.]MDA8643322.1 ABC transporter ATP-binding protein/permease [Candidatus Pelagibacter bacterium]MDB2441820.1 ABC transporter ATP-binding protein/permease [Candidatus Pelagibacter bacterium]MDB2678769.1 ABC transporter ATP-binding protein/permease [Candidatus Pelagibacter bacterium]MDC0408282.1 ABC transporter ATP-binding protein/permease [Candidatus Pelagibacter sp.]